MVYFHLVNNVCKKEKHSITLVTSRLYSSKKTVKFEPETKTYRGSQIWNSILDNIKNAPSPEIFEKKIKKWKGETWK